MRLPSAKRVVVDNLPPEIQEPMQSIAGILNPFIEDVTTLLNGGLGSDNLERKIVKFEVKTNALSEISGLIDVATGLYRAPSGINIVNIQMGDNAQQVPNITEAPFILWQPISASAIRILKVLNLKENSKYSITIEII